jgi:hypothetical protein
LSHRSRGRGIVAAGNWCQGLGAAVTETYRRASVHFAGTVTLGDFDMGALFSQAFDQAGVAADFRARTLGKYCELRANNPY